MTIVHKITIDSTNRITVYTQLGDDVPGGISATVVTESPAKTTTRLESVELQ